MSEKRVILLVGPTAVGKTGASISLARELSTEIIGADSMQIYRHMDIGTGKPTADELAAVPHHMIDIVEPSEDYSAGKYLEAVAPIIERLHGAEKIPLIVGGTGLYVKAMTRGLFDGPEADWGLREKLLEQSPAGLYDRLKALDPEAAGGINPADARRIVRALEVCLKSGGKLSEIREAGTHPMPYEFIKVALVRERAELYSMIEARVEAMMRLGLKDEVRRVMGMNPARTPMQAIGYKEMAAHINGDYPLQEAVRLIKRNTRRYAKRQLTWFGADEGLLWVDVTGLRSSTEVYVKLMESLNLPQGGL